MLARGTHQSLSILTAGRANKRRLVLQHLFHQELSGFIVHRANAGTIKRLETKIRNINASSHSAEFKYRNSVRFFAMIDQAKNCMELKALHAKGAACLEQILKSSSTERPAEQKSAEKACDRCFAEVKEIVHRSSAIFRELARLQWVVFKFTVFAPRGDVSIRERSMRVPLFVLQVFGNTVGRYNGSRCRCLRLRRFLHSQQQTDIFRPAPPPVPRMHLSDFQSHGDEDDGMG